MAESQRDKIRRAGPQDARELLNIYRPIVEDTAISFEMTPPGEDEFALRIDSSIRNHEWLVLDDGNGLFGYAYATPHKAREAYQLAVETSVYVHVDHRGHGVGKRLYVALFESLSKLGFHNAYAGITMPNVGSQALHRSVGFEPIGTFREVGFKYGKWHDVYWCQRGLDC